jgi:general secretion pathway protein H
MQILESSKESCPSYLPISSEGGFTLIEMLLALAIVAIFLGVAVLAIPNHDERYWRSNLDQLVSSLNAAQEESQTSGIPMRVEINQSGWRFSRANLAGQTQDPASIKTFIPEAYQAKAWFKSVNMEPIQLNLGTEYVNEELRLPIHQDKRFATLVRSNDGRFYWTNP